MTVQLVQEIHLQLLLRKEIVVGLALHLTLMAAAVAVVLLQ
jgi:hypothetical protein